MNCPYEVLGLCKKASFEEIKSKYRSLSKLHHPDVGGDQDVFVLINWAYTVLIDPETRELYDTTGVIKNTTEDRIIHAKSIERFNELLVQILVHDEFLQRQGNIDLVQCIKDNINNTLKQIEVAIRTLKRQKDVFDKVKDRIRLKTEDDFISASLANFRDRLEQGIITATLDFKITEAMLELSNNISYDFQQARFITISSNVTSSSVHSFFWE